MPPRGDTREPSEFEWKVGPSGIQSRVRSTRPWLLPACGLGLLFVVGLVVSPALREWVGALVTTVVVVAAVTAVVVYRNRPKRRKRGWR